MRKTSNLDLRLYDASDKFDITNTSNSLNSNMEIIDRQVNNLNNNIKGIDELKKETASLKEYLKTRNDQSEYLFVSERKPHGQLKKEAVERSVRIIGKRSGINRDLFPHLFRNTISSVLVSKSVPITQVQRLLGHENINTTMQYVKILDDDVKNSHEKFS